MQCNVPKVWEIFFCGVAFSEASRSHSFAILVCLTMYSTFWYPRDLWRMRCYCPNALTIHYTWLSVRTLYSGTYLWNAAALQYSVTIQNFPMKCRNQIYNILAIFLYLERKWYKMNKRITYKPHWNLLNGDAFIVCLVVGVTKPRKLNTELF